MRPQRVHNTVGRTRERHDDDDDDDDITSEMWRGMRTVGCEEEKKEKKPNRSVASIATTRGFRNDDGDDNNYRGSRSITGRRRPSRYCRGRTTYQPIDRLITNNNKRSHTTMTFLTSQHGNHGSRNRWLHTRTTDGDYRTSVTPRTITSSS